jgi:hypothetical protein
MACYYMMNVTIIKYLFSHDLHFSRHFMYFLNQSQWCIFLQCKGKNSSDTCQFIKYVDLLLFVMGMFQRESRVQKENELVSFLQLQLAEAINLQDRSLIAHLHETLRCIRLFDDSGWAYVIGYLRCYMG